MLQLALVHLGPVGERGDILLIESICRRIETLDWNLVVWKNACKRCSRRDRRSSFRGHCRRASGSGGAAGRAACQQRRERCIGECSGEKWKR